MVVRHFGTATFRELVQLSDSWVPTVREFDFSRLLNKYEKKMCITEDLLFCWGILEGGGCSVLYILLISHAGLVSIIKTPRLTII